MVRTSSAGRSIRRITSGAALVLFPALLAIAGPVDPEASSGADVYRAATEQSGALTAAGLLLMASGILTVPAIAGLVRQVRDRGAGLTNTGAVLEILGATGHISLGAAYVLVRSFRGGDREQMAAFFDRIGHDGVFLSIFFPMLLFVGLGLVLLAWGAWRAGLIGIWGPAVTTVAILAHLLLPEGIHVAEEAELLGLAAVYGYLGLRVLRMSQVEWDGARPATPPGLRVGRRPARITR